jgi:hypothetical protein
MERLVYDVGIAPRVIMNHIFNIVWKSTTGDIFWIGDLRSNQRGDLRSMYQYSQP